jgi:hypothetical protein
MNQYLEQLKAWAETHVRNPKETQHPHLVDCELYHDREGEWHPHTASLSENGDCVRAFNAIANGFAGDIQPYDWATHWAKEFEYKRSQLLNGASLSNQDYDELTKTQKTKVKEYREALKALEFEGDSEFNDWPVKPDFI